MDYKTRRISRKKIRSAARLFRAIFSDCVSSDGLFVNVIKITDKIPDIPGFNIEIEIVDDGILGDIPGRCMPNYNGEFLIQIKETVFDGACDGIGGYRMHIMHELSHAFLCMLGYAPICERNFKNYQLMPCESMEWQAKALAGEILIDYELTKGMNTIDIVDKCGVSIDSAINRVKRGQ